MTSRRFKARLKRARRKRYLTNNPQERSLFTPDVWVWAVYGVGLGAVGGWIITSGLTQNTLATVALGCVDIFLGIAAMWQVRTLVDKNYQKRKRIIELTAKVETMALFLNGR